MNVKRMSNQELLDEYTRLSCLRSSQPEIFTREMAAELEEVEHEMTRREE